MGDSNDYLGWVWMSRQKVPFNRSGGRQTLTLAVVGVNSSSRSVLVNLAKIRPTDVTRVNGSIES